MAKPRIKLKPVTVDVTPPKAPEIKFMTADDVVVMHMDKIVAHWAGGLTFHKITEELGLPITAAQLRTRILHDDELREKLNTVHTARAAALIDRATQAADDAIDSASPAFPAGFGTGAKILITLAEKLDKANWGTVKGVELTGKNGGPVEVKADMTLSPADAYERMVKGG